MVDLVKAPPCVPRSSAPVQLFVRGSTLCLASRDSNGSGVPRYLASWTVRDFRRFGILDGKFCFEVANGDGGLKIQKAFVKLLFICVDDVIRLPRG